MFIEDIRNDFYNVLLGNRVLLLVHYDVDAVCTCKILQGLFKADNISYTLVPVGGISELKTAYEENNEEIKYVVLINCGGTIDLVDVLQPEEDVVFFILDSHKPTDVCNVYSDGQVRLVYKDEEENIPNFDDIFRDDEEEEEESVGREGLEALVERRRERRAWEERRNTLMFNYTQFSYYGKPSSCVAVELAFVTSRCSWAALWAGAVGVAPDYRRTPAQELLDTDCVNRHIGHYASSNANTSASISLEQDLDVPLYRVWSLESALRCSPALGPALRPAARLHQLLADMGVPLQQARGAYTTMDVELRRGLLEALQRAAPRASLPPPARAAFLLRRAHRPPAAARDLALALAGLLDHETLPRAEGFQQALLALELVGGGEARREGVAAAQRALEACARVAALTLSSRTLHLAGPFSYFIIQEGTCEAGVLGGALWLGAAARWAARCAGGRPLVASAARGPTALLVGVPPRFHQEPRNLFGAAFEQAAAKCGAAVSLDHFDSSVISIPLAQRPHFLDALTALLA